MTFDEYQKQSKKTAQYSDFVPPFVYLTMGLAGESGETIDKIKKVVRNNNGKFTPEDLQEIKKELGDVLWYLSQLATQFDMSLEDVASTNLDKLFDRLKRNKIRSRGDNR